MRQTMKEIEVNVAYRWFLGLDMLDPVPHFSTFGKNYTRRFKDTDLFEQIFSKILEDCMHEFEKTGKDPGKTRLEHSQIFVDFEENKKKRSFKRKMVLGIIPNTKFVYSLGAVNDSPFFYYAPRIADIFISFSVSLRSMVPPSSTVIYTSYNSFSDSVSGISPFSF